MMMMASQIDRTGNQNISAIGPHAKPKVQLVGVRGAPGNSVNHPTSYWVPDHTVRTFVEQVDVVSGVGYARAEAAGPGATRFHRIPRVVSNLGVFDFETPDHTMRLRSYHPGVTVDDVVAATGFTLDRPRRRGRDPPAHARGARAHPRRARPGLAARPRGEALSVDGADATPLHPALAHRAVRAHRHPLPAGADRHGLGGRPPPGGRHHGGRRAGHPGLGHHEPRRAGRRHRRGPPAHQRPLRRQPAHRRGRRQRAHRGR